MSWVRSWLKHWIWRISILRDVSTLESLCHNESTLEHLAAIRAEIKKHPRPK